MTKGVCPLNLSLNVNNILSEHFTAPDQASSDVQRFATLCRASIAEYTTPSAVTIYFILYLKIKEFAKFMSEHFIHE